MGGEKQTYCLRIFSPGGSPPHGRGKDAEFVVTVAGGGITPAWAGKSLIETVFNKSVRDHPRMGGEKTISDVPYASI